MNTYLKKLLASIGLAALSLVFCTPTHPDTRKISTNKTRVSSELDKSMQNESKGDTSVGFLPDVNAAIEAAGVSGGDYDARITRKLHLDALRVRDWIVDFAIREQNLLAPSPSQLDHEFTYVGIGYKAAHGKIKLFWDHTCYNPSRKLPKNKRNDIHWNELGIGYETPGMILGHKNDGIQFDSGSEWLQSINWGVSLSRIWMRTENEYEWMGKLNMRYDIFRHGRQVFYIQPGLKSIYDDRGFNQDYYIEVGDRIGSYRNICLTPFISYEHFHDWYSLGQGEDFFLAGLRLEMGLGHETRKNFSGPEKQKISWIPKFHITGGYANIVNNKDYGHSSDFALDLDLLRLDQDKKLGLNSYIGILTIPRDLNPYIVKYEIGPFLEIDLDNLDLRIFHSYSSLYGVENRGLIRNYNFLGLELKNNNRSHWNWNMKIGGYPSTKNFDYWGDLQGSLGYDFYEQGIAPYINSSSRYLPGDNSLFGHAIEAGVKIPGKAGSFSLYLRLQDDFDVFRFGKGTQKLLGIRFSF